MDRPLFSNGTEHMFWESENCERCFKFNGADYHASTCDLLIHMLNNQCGIPLPPEIEKRLGVDESGYALRRCGEFQEAP